MASAMQAVWEKVRAPFVHAPKDQSLVAQIEERRQAMRNRHWTDHGRLLGMRFDISEAAAYETVRNAQTHREKMLFFEWLIKDAPIIGLTKQKAFIFPVGLEEPPKTIADTYVNAIHAEKNPVRTVGQNILDHADGYIAGRDGSAFMVVQPVTYFVVIACGAMIRYSGRTDGITGKKPALLFDPRTKEAHLIGGVFVRE